MNNKISLGLFCIMMFTATATAQTSNDYYGNFEIVESTTNGVIETNYSTPNISVEVANTVDTANISIYNENDVFLGSGLQDGFTGIEIGLKPELYPGTHTIYAEIFPEGEPDNESARLKSESETLEIKENVFISTNSSSQNFTSDIRYEFSYQPVDSFNNRTCDVFLNNEQVQVFTDVSPEPNTYFDVIEVPRGENQISVSCGPSGNVIQNIQSFENGEVVKEDKSPLEQALYIIVALMIIGVAYDIRK